MWIIGIDTTVSANILFISIIAAFLGMPRNTDISFLTPIFLTAVFFFLPFSRLKGSDCRVSSTTLSFFFLLLPAWGSYTLSASLPKPLSVRTFDLIHDPLLAPSSLYTKSYSGVWWSWSSDISTFLGDGIFGSLPQCGVWLGMCTRWEATLLLGAGVCPATSAWDLLLMSRLCC